MPRYPESGNRDVDAVLSGIGELDERLERNTEMRIAEMHELILALEASGMSASAAFGALKKLRPHGGSVSGLERAALCREYLARYRSAPFTRDIFFGSAEAHDRKIEYIGNKYTDEAFAIFSSRLEDAEAVIANNFGELCDDVYEGRSEFGILPIETSDNGKLLRFYSLIDRYDLKIAAVCSTEAPDSTVTRFALVRKSIEYPDSQFGRPEMLEFFVPSGNGSVLSEILPAADFCNMRLIRVDSLPLSYRDGQFTLCPAFDVSSSDIDTFLTYMALDHPQFTPIGIFSYLD